MRTYEEAYEAARDRRPFANGTEGQSWMGNWCYTPCMRDVLYQRDINPQGCPLIMVALMDRTPSEWLDGPRDEQGRYSLGDQYHCMEFRPPGGGGGEPRPRPDPPGQGVLWPREPYQGPRMFIQAVTADRAPAMV